MKKSKIILLGCAIIVTTYIFGFFISPLLAIKVQKMPYGAVSKYIWKHYQECYHATELEEGNYVQTLWFETNIFWCNHINSCEVVMEKGVQLR